MDTPVAVTSRQKWAGRRPGRRALTQLAKVRSSAPAPTPWPRSRPARPGPATHLASLLRHKSPRLRNDGPHINSSGSGFLRHFRHTIVPARPLGIARNSRPRKWRECWPAWNGTSPPFLYDRWNSTLFSILPIQNFLAFEKCVLFLHLIHPKLNVKHYFRTFILLVITHAITSIIHFRNLRRVWSHTIKLSWTSNVRFKSYDLV